MKPSFSVSHLSKGPRDFVKKELKYESNTNVISELVHKHRYRENFTYPSETHSGNLVVVVPDVLCFS